MSGYLAGKVWRSGLSADLKPFAAALADVANDDGTNIYPSIDYMCWLTGRSERTIRGWLSDLRELKVLHLIGEVTDLKKLGRGYGAEYEMVIVNLPNRPKWTGPQTAKTHAKFAGLKQQSYAKRRTKALQNAASSLLLDPSVDPSVHQPVSKPPKQKNKLTYGRHKTHVFCGDLFCVDAEKHARFEKRLVAAGEDLNEHDLVTWYAARDAELSTGEETTTDHPALWLEKQFAGSLKDSVRD